MKKLIYSIILLFTALSCTAQYTMYVSKRCAPIVVTTSNFESVASAPNCDANAITFPHTINRTGNTSCSEDIAITIGNLGSGVITNVLPIGATVTSTNISFPSGVTQITFDVVYNPFNCVSGSLTNLSLDFGALSNSCNTLGTLVNSTIGFNPSAVALADGSGALLGCAGITPNVVIDMSAYITGWTQTSFANSADLLAYAQLIDPASEWRLNNDCVLYKKKGGSNVSYQIVPTAYPIKLVDLINPIGTPIVNGGLYDYSVFSIGNFTSNGGASSVPLTSDADVIAYLASIGKVATISGTDILISNWSVATPPSDIEVSANPVLRYDICCLANASEPNLGLRNITINGITHDFALPYPTSVAQAVTELNSVSFLGFNNWYEDNCQLAISLPSTSPYITAPKPASGCRSKLFRIPIGMVAWKPAHTTYNGYSDIVDAEPYNSTIRNTSGVPGTPVDGVHYYSLLVENRGAGLVRPAYWGNTNRADLFRDSYQDISTDNTFASNQNALGGNQAQTLAGAQAWRTAFEAWVQSRYDLPGIRGSQVILTSTTPTSTATAWVWNYALYLWTDCDVTEMRLREASWNSNEMNVGTNWEIPNFVTIQHTKNSVLQPAPKGVYNVVPSIDNVGGSANFDKNNCDTFPPYNSTTFSN